MPPLPPKPKGKPVVKQALVVAALSTAACARQHQHLRIGQPPPPRIGPQVCKGIDAQITDNQGSPLGGVEVRLSDGERLVSDAQGYVSTMHPPIDGMIEHPGFAPVQVYLDCSGAVVQLPPAEQVIEPVRIGAEEVPQDPEALERPPPRIGMAPREQEPGA